MAEEVEKKEPREELTFDWGNVLASGFFFAMGSALFAGLLWSGKKIYEKARRKGDDDE